MTTQSLADRVRTVLALEPGAVAVETKEVRNTWGEIAAAAGRVEALLEAAGANPAAPVGWVARNRPGAVAAFVSLIMNRRMVVPLRPRQASGALSEDLAQQKLQAVIGDEEDWADEGIVLAADAAGTLGIAMTGTAPGTARVLKRLDRIGDGPHRAAMPGFVLERLTSGTTGVPKRIAVLESVLVPALRSAERAGADGPADALRLKTSPAILLKPFSHAGGLFGLLLALYQARPMVLFDKFTPQDWAAAVKRYKPKSASLVPAMIQMIMEADIAPQDLASLRAVRAGTAPLNPQTQLRFEERFGVPILIDYGAAEFIGGVAGWTLDDHRKYSAAKRGSVGRARPDVDLKVTAPDTGERLESGKPGILHIKSARFGPDWVRTHDLASIDEDGFVFLHGRSDDAINRGGFKILPEEVAAVLRTYPGVRDAAVVGKPDPRLGHVPIAAIEMAAGVAAPDAAEIEAFARRRLTAYMVPKEFRFVVALPRTASMKVSRPELKALLGI